MTKHNTPNEPLPSLAGIETVLRPSLGQVSSELPVALWKLVAAIAKRKKYAIARLVGWVMHISPGSHSSSEPFINKLMPLPPFINEMQNLWDLSTRDVPSRKIVVFLRERDRERCCNEI